jgi:DNA replication protein DnaC
MAVCVSGSWEVAMRHDPASAAVVIMLRSLKMYGMAQAVTDLIEQVAPAFDAAVPILSQLLKADMAEREVRSIAYHMKAARFPAYKDISGYDFAASEINEATVRQLHRCEFIDGAQNIVLVGGPGTGKTHIATALGVQAIEHHRRKVRFFSTIELVNALEQEKARGKAGQIAEALVRLDLLILDELGYLPFSASGGALLFHLLSKLYERQHHHHHEPQLQRMGYRLRRRHNDNRFARPPDPPLPYPGNRRRQLPLQSQFARSSTEERRKGQSLDQTLIRKPYLEVAHFSVEKPAQFRMETNSCRQPSSISAFSRRSQRGSAIPSRRSSSLSRTDEASLPQI